MDETDEKVQEWEQLMWKYQRQYLAARPGEKWRLMDKNICPKSLKGLWRAIK